MTIDDDLIAKYLSGEATPEEAIALSDWLEVPANKIRFEELESTWNHVNPSRKVRAINKEAAWRKIQPTQPLGISRNFRIGIAASIMLVLVVGMWLYVQKPVVTGLSVVTTDTTRGVTFADNSKVTLYRNTSIEFPEQFTGSKREVKLLAGEAFFSVAKDPAKPFVIHASFTDIKVVGTQFNVSMKGDEVEVAVSEGRVLVTSNVDSVYLDAGSAARFAINKKATTSETDPNTWAYASRVLDFKDTPVDEVIRTVEKMYGCEISVTNDSVNKCPITAHFNNDSVDKVLLLISDALNVKLEQNGKVFILEGEGSCPH
ncbi:MAG: FecR domain-containing protein [Bacteroidota bacterium]